MQTRSPCAQALTLGFGIGTAVGHQPHQSQAHPRCDGGSSRRCRTAGHGSSDTGNKNAGSRRHEIDETGLSAFTDPLDELAVGIGKPRLELLAAPLLQLALRFAQAVTDIGKETGRLTVCKIDSRLESTEKPRSQIGRSALCRTGQQGLLRLRVTRIEHARIKLGFNRFQIVFQALEMLDVVFRDGQQSRIGIHGRHARILLSKCLRRRPEHTHELSARRHRLFHFGRIDTGCRLDSIVDCCLCRLTIAAKG